MDYQKLEILLKNSPTLKLLRAKNAALIISFLYIQFREQNEINIKNENLVQKLAHYLDEHESMEEESLSEFGLDNYERARRYIEQWTNENYLRNYVDESQKTVFNVLTQHTERVFQVLELLKEREFVGTESKFKDIFRKLQELVDNNTDDPQKRIKELELRKQQIEEEIRRIKREGTVVKFEDYQIRSRFEEVSRLTNELIGDFKEVEDIFKNITRTIYEKQSQREVSKGKILHYTFDALDELEQSDQGKSFYAFWNFLIDDRSQEELKELTLKVGEILNDRGITFNAAFLRRIKAVLHQSGRKVIETNSLLADKLGRVIAEKSILENKKLRATIADIKRLAFAVVNTDKAVNCGIETETRAEINMPLERPLGVERKVVDYDLKVEDFKDEADWESMAALFNPLQINPKALLKQVQVLMTDRSQVTLQEVLRHYPLTKGLGEVVGYFSLLNHSAKFFVNDKEREQIVFDKEKGKYIEIPQIIFTK